MRPSNDREAVTLILDGLTSLGMKVTSVCDDTWNPNETTDVSTVAEAVDLVMGVDEATVYITNLDGKESFIYFVLGNDPEEVACDYGVSLDPHLSNIVDPWWN